MEIKIMGPGCVKCRGLYHRVLKAVAELNIHAKVLKVEDLTEIMHYGIIRPPALVIDEKVVMSGCLPNYAELKEFLIPFKNTDKRAMEGLLTHQRPEVAGLGILPDARDC